MKKFHLLIIFAVFTTNFGFSQTRSDVDMLLNQISKTENSREITKTDPAQKLIEYGWRILPTLGEFFNDQTPTNLRSECIGRNLNKGEIAIIMADRIEGMPYYPLTGIQNDTLIFCKNNPNLIEYYLPYIIRDGINNFQEKYQRWLVSDERIEWRPILDYKTKKERKAINRERKKAILEMQKGK